MSRPSGRKRSWDYPECPQCKSDVFVSHTSNTHYMCEMCNISFDHGNGETIDPRPPQTKGTRKNWHKENTKIKPPTENELKKIYNTFSHFHIGRSGMNDKKLHLPTNGVSKTLCDRGEGDRSVGLRKVKTDIYPPGHKGICKNCLLKWREL